MLQLRMSVRYSIERKNIEGTIPLECAGIDNAF
jgi:hypothetical protein